MKLLYALAGASVVATAVSGACEDLKRRACKADDSCIYLKYRPFRKNPPKKAKVKRCVTDIGCPTWPVKTKCKKNGCHWHGTKAAGSCHKNPPTEDEIKRCRTRPKKSRCLKAECFWAGSKADGECVGKEPTNICPFWKKKFHCKKAGCHWHGTKRDGECKKQPETDEEKKRCKKRKKKGRCKAAGCYWSGSKADGECLDEAPGCGDWPTMKKCEKKGCFWSGSKKDGECIDEAPACDDWETVRDCKKAGCVWSGTKAHGACFEEEASCDDWTTPSKCKKAGCDWFRGACRGGTDTTETPETTKAPEPTTKAVCGGRGTMSAAGCMCEGMFTGVDCEIEICPTGGCTFHYAKDEDGTPIEMSYQAAKKYCAARGSTLPMYLENNALYNQFRDALIEQVSVPWIASGKKDYNGSRPFWVAVRGLDLDYEGHDGYLVWDDGKRTPVQGWRRHMDSDTHYSIKDTSIGFSWSGYPGPLGAGCSYMGYGDGGTEMKGWGIHSACGDLKFPPGDEDTKLTPWEDIGVAHARTHVMCFEPPPCGGKGTKTDAGCECDGFFTGPACEIAICPPGECEFSLVTGPDGGKVEKTYQEAKAHCASLGGTLPMYLEVPGMHEAFKQASIEQVSDVWTDHYSYWGFSWVALRGLDLTYEKDFEGGDMVWDDGHNGGFGTRVQGFIPKGDKTGHWSFHGWELRGGKKVWDSVGYPNPYGVACSSMGYGLREEEDVSGRTQHGWKLQSSCVGTHIPKEFEGRPEEAVWEDLDTERKMNFMCYLPSVPAETTKAPATTAAPTTAGPCGGKGTMTDAGCKCDGFFTGADCEIAICPPGECGFTVAKGSDGKMVTMKYQAAKAHCAASGGTLPMYLEVPGMHEAYKNAAIEQISEVFTGHWSDTKAYLWIATRGLDETYTDHYEGGDMVWDDGKRTRVQGFKVKGDFEGHHSEHFTLSPTVWEVWAFPHWGNVGCSSMAHGMAEEKALTGRKRHGWRIMNGCVMINKPSGGEAWEDLDTEREFGVMCYG